VYVLFFLILFSYPKLQQKNKKNRRRKKYVFHTVGGLCAPVEGFKHSG